MGSSWSCVAGCGRGAHASQASNNEPMQVHNAHETLGTPWLRAESMDELQPVLVPIRVVPEDMQMLELHLVYSPEDGQFEYMVEIPRPVRAAQATDPGESVWLTWLQERVDYGEP